MEDEVFFEEPAKASNGAQIAGAVTVLFVLATVGILIIKGLDNFALIIVACPLLIFLLTTVMLQRWLTAGGVEGGSALKYVAFANVLGLLLICSGLIAVVYAPAPAPDPAPPATTTCTALRAPENGKIDPATCLAATPSGTTCTYSCNDGYNLKGSSTTTCTSGTWSDPAPTCERGFRFLYR